MPHKYAAIDGVATFLHHCGPTTLPEVAPDLSAGELVLCLHGVGGNGAQWREVQDALHAAGHSPLAFDQPGHGRSGGLDSLGAVERMVDFARALVGKLGLRAPLLLGHDLGAAVALRWGLDHPEELRGLALVGGAAHPPETEAALEQLRRVAEGKARRAFERQGYAPGTPAEVMQRGFLEELKTDPRATYGDLLAWSAFDVRGELGRLRLPVCVLAGAHERPALRAQCDLLAAEIPGARFAEIPAAGHMLPLEQPGPLAGAVAAFAAELPA